MAIVDEIKSKTGTMNPEKREGKMAKMIESQTAKLPSDAFLWTALGVMTTSLVLKMAKQDKLSLFVGQWVPTFLLFGLYNKIVKVEGHDQKDKN